MMNTNRFPRGFLSTTQLGRALAPHVARANVERRARVAGFGGRIITDDELDGLNSAVLLLNADVASSQATGKLASLAFSVRWGDYVARWSAFYSDKHGAPTIQQSGDDVVAAFHAFENEYSALRREFLSLGGQTSSPDLEAQPVDERSPFEKAVGTEAQGSLLTSPLVLGGLVVAGLFAAASLAKATRPEPAK